MKIQLYSKKSAGKWAAGFTVFFIISMAVKISALSRLVRLPLPTPVLAVIGIAGFIMGIISIVKNKDRALLTLLTMPVGLLIICWTAAEMAFPH